MLITRPENNIQTNCSRKGNTQRWKDMKNSANLRVVAFQANNWECNEPIDRARRLAQQTTQLTVKSGMMQRVIRQKHRP